MVDVEKREAIGGGTPLTDGRWHTETRGVAAICPRVERFARCGFRKALNPSGCATSSPLDQPPRAQRRVEQFLTQTCGSKGGDPYRAASSSPRDRPTSRSAASSDSESSVSSPSRSASATARETRARSSAETCGER